jgi:hypothetical protein
VRDGSVAEVDNQGCPPCSNSEERVTVVGTGPSAQLNVTRGMLARPAPDEPLNASGVTTLAQATTESLAVHPVLHAHHPPAETEPTDPSDRRRHERKRARDARGHALASIGETAANVRHRDPTSIGRPATSPVVLLAGITGYDWRRAGITADPRAGSTRDYAQTGNRTCPFAGPLRERRDSNPRPPARQATSRVTTIGDDCRAIALFVRAFGRLALSFRMIV